MTLSARSHLALIRTDGSACARCAQHFSTCCVIAPEVAEYGFPLSPMEQAAIKTHTGTDAAMAYVPNTPSFIKAIQILFPGEKRRIAEIFPASAFHWRLAVDARGACLFLDETGCRLPRDIRPIYCHLFPFWVNKGEINHFSLSDCQAQRECRSRVALQEAFAVTDNDVFACYSALRAGWNLPPQRR